MQTGRAQLADWIDRRQVNQLEASAIIGIDPAVLSLVLNGKRRPGLDSALKIERATGIPVEAWASIADDKPTPTPAGTDEPANVGKA